MWVPAAEFNTKASVSDADDTLARFPAVSSSNGNNVRSPNIVIVDFDDSYTNNLIKILPSSYSNHEASRLLVANWKSFDWQAKDFQSQVLPHTDCVILSPGPGDPTNEKDFGLGRDILLNAGIPILGVCLGHQGLAVAFGGKIIHAPEILHGQLSEIAHDGCGLFQGIPNGYKVVRYNSLTVDPNCLPSDLKVTAWADDGPARTVMGLQHRTKPIFAVQFHPESISSENGIDLMSNFVHLVKDYWFKTDSARLSNTSGIPPSVLRASSILRNDTSIPPNPEFCPTFVKYSKGSAKWQLRTEKVYTCSSEGGEEAFDAKRVFHQFIRNKSALGEIWFDSARQNDPQSRFSYLAWPSVVWSYVTTTRTLTTHTVANGQAVKTDSDGWGGGFWDIVHNVHNTIRSSTSVQAHIGRRPPCGFMGYFSYEMTRETLPSFKPLDPNNKAYEEGESDAELAFASGVLQYDAAERTWTSGALVLVSGEADDDVEERWGFSEEGYRDWISKVRTFFKSPPNRQQGGIGDPSPQTWSGSSASVRLRDLRFAPDVDGEQYVKAIDRARQKIKDGESYELCLTTQFRTTLPPSSKFDPYALYLELRQQNPAPYSAFMHFRASGTSQLSSSPERFMRIDADGNVEMKPIKGTTRRCRDDPVEDDRRKLSLANDLKERAENLMIVDLIRSDLLRVCVPESVQVPKLMQIESFETVHQMVTSVVGKLADSSYPVLALKACFPPGSMTGAPKLRSVQILDQLEQGRPRGVYSGILGYLAVDGSSDFSVVIRTISSRRQNLSIGAGGAITWKSDPFAEWDEVLVKLESVTGKPDESQTSSA